MIFTHYAISRQIEELGTLLQDVQQNPDAYSDTEINTPAYSEYIANVCILNKLCNLCHKNSRVEYTSDTKQLLKLATELAVCNTETLAHSTLTVSFTPEDNMVVDYGDLQHIDEKLLTSMWIAGNELPNSYNLLHSTILAYENICINLAESVDYAQAAQISKYLKEIKTYLDYMLVTFKTLLNTLFSTLKPLASEKI